MIRSEVSYTLTEQIVTLVPKPKDSRDGFSPLKRPVLRPVPTSPYLKLCLHPKTTIPLNNESRETSYCD